MENRNYSIDLIRLVAILGVIIIHTSTYFIDRTAAFTFTFYVLHIINQASRFAVPSFFVISGFLLGSKYHNILNPIIFYKKRISKILIPYLLWSLIYFLIIFPNPINSVFRNIFFHDLITGDASYQLYFIPGIIILYFLFPFVIYFKKILLTKLFVFLTFILEAIVLSYVYFFEPKIAILSPFVISFYNFLPFLIGIFAATKIINFHHFIKKHIFLFWVVSLISFCFIFGESIYMFLMTQKPMYLRDQWRISVMIYGTAVSAIFYYYYKKSWDKMVMYLSSFSFGVFFVHTAILHEIVKVLDVYKLYNLFWFSLALFITVIGSFLFSIVFSKIKILNKLLGLRG